MNRHRIMFIALVTLVIAACKPEAPIEAPKSVKYYEDNAAERKSMLVRCKDLPGDATKDPNCSNARQAELASAARASTGTVNFKDTKVPYQDSKTPK